MKTPGLASDFVIIGVPRYSQRLIVLEFRNKTKVARMFENAGEKLAILKWSSCVQSTAHPRRALLALLPLSRRAGCRTK